MKLKKSTHSELIQRQKIQYIYFTMNKDLIDEINKLVEDPLLKKNSVEFSKYIPD